MSFVVWVGKTQTRMYLSEWAHPSALKEVPSLHDPSSFTIFL